MTLNPSIEPALAQALEKRGYESLTPVQESVLNPELRDADLLVSAQTGSGKTVAFGMAMAATLLGGEPAFGRPGASLALVIAPTRELAMQVERELTWLYGEAGARIATCVGGMNMMTERRTLERGVHVVVGTPGRLRDHIERGYLDLSAIRAVVLDEADEMLDLGFRDDLEFILDASPDARRTLMFSATVPSGIANLAKRYQRDAVRVTTAGDRKQHLDIEYRALSVAPNDRENAVINVLRYYDAKNALVFCGTRATVNHLVARFSNRGFSVVALSGELSQNERTHALQALRDGRAQVCVATDVAARGLDLPDLELVIHADLPKNPESLLHRSGRTGRAGRKGVSALIVPYAARRRTERLFSDARIEATWARPPSAEEIVARDDERLLADSTLTEAVHEDEALMVAALLEQHGADKVAAAFVRMHRAKRTAPEELIDNGPVAAPGGTYPERSAPRDHQALQDGVWFSLSLGRKQQAEPRWLLPMLCRAGHVTKNDIGSIRIHDTETHVEIAGAAVARFLAAVGPTKKIEKTITVTQLVGAPAIPERGSKDSSPRPLRAPRAAMSEDGKIDYAKKRPFTGKARRDDDRAPTDGPYADRKPGAEGDAPKGKAGAWPYDDVPPARADAYKPYPKTDGPAGDKKPYKAKPFKGKGDNAGKPPFKGKGDKPYAKSGSGKPYAGSKKP
ncbi:ATP-dependent RNA helicase DeaD [Hoeflea marina]|uniref:ATP-dependent RNA helicase DeaD n=1 Tax=Hoeflea marina TaxID=274592 RepID=A0A317PN22_9HYPH|nr:DEAD/DEAH box helicase [Hoeflea marina]PWW01651.1 ATP-dependent RNA helicase DeaD [Hoeflea marina]